MEIVIPPRDHGPSTFRYTWDENGEVSQITRVVDDSSSSIAAAIPPNIARGRQTVQWPFQSIVTETDLSSPSISTFLPTRVATWQPKPTRDYEYDTDSIATEKDIIPDYVVNYLRGETPETVAQRRLNGGKLGHRGPVDLERQEGAHQSRVADFEGFYFDSTSRLGSGEEERQILPSSRRGSGSSNRWGQFTVGWRAGLALNVLLWFLILVAGFVCFILAISRVSLFAGRSVIFAGSCAMASSINWGLHAALSAFGVVLVAGANYVFQVLSSPTRNELDVAHEKRKWLDLGIPSLRNLRHVEGTRTMLAIIILLSAVFTQTVYNAVIFNTQAAPDFKLVLATEAFLKGAPFSNGTSNNRGMLSRFDLLTLQQQAIRGDLVNISTPECFRTFEGAFETDFKAALLITNLDSQSTSLLQTSSKASPALASVITTESIADLTLDQFSVQYCLAQPVGDASQTTCEVDLNGSLLGAVALLNLITVVSVAMVLLFIHTPSSFQPLATLGDAIASFLRCPDPTTQGACLLSETDVWQGRWGSAVPKYWIPDGDHYWFRTPSLSRWLFASISWCVCVGLTVAALVISVMREPSSSLSPFGIASPHNSLILVPSLSMSAAAILASLPHLGLAVLYFSLNGIMTAYYLSHESSLFATTNKPARPLRVSADPEGAQTASLYLTLPRPASWFLIVAFISLSFVLSQSFFAVTIQLVDMPISQPTAVTPNFVPPPTATVIALSFSGVGLLILLALLVVLAVIVVGLGFRRAPPAGLVNGQLVGNPMALPDGSCSAVISSRCHGNGTSNAREAHRERLWAKELVWGVIREGEGMDVSHCGFATEEKRIGVVGVARCYA
ncbi:hypothetical protein B0H63DRAFT_236952 [Podospora didyma]|uniref:DUF6536 domain-containing protein n=1 Tax=Podospora didyma TaxID=330526 RepID=A0AAE0KKC9_9PEZI|nr:hypothetical protein B0H63DRAFT_236952 [Podospora didyma]